MAKKRDLQVLPIESGTNPDGIPYVKAMVVADPSSPMAKGSPMAAIFKGAGTRSRIPKDAPKSFYRTGAMVEPYLKPQVLAEFMLSNPIHAIAVKKKARLVAGMGIKLITKFNEREARTTVRTYEKEQEQAKEERKAARDAKAQVQSGTLGSPLVAPGSPDEAAPDPFGQMVKMFKADRKAKQEYDAAKQKLATSKQEMERLQAFIDDASDETTFREVLERGWQDFESLGNMNWEVLRDADGEPARLNHVPSIMLRVTKDRERFAYIAPPYTKPVFFKQYGDPRHLNLQTGEFRKWTGTPGQADFNPGADWGDSEATEILRYIAYDPQDTYYGIPTWYAAMADMLGGAESRDFMLRFFTDKAVPLYAVLLEGGAWSQQTIAMIEKFFRRELVGNYHATLALEVPTGGKITFQQVSPEPRWWPFILKYREAVQDIVISVHGLSPSIVGVIETAHLGGGTGGDQIETVKTTEIRPRQETLEWLLNTFLVRRGLGLDLVMLKLDEIDTEDEAKVATAIASLFANPTRPSLTLNDTRKMLRLDPIDADWADKILISDPQFGLMPLEDMEAAVRQKQKAMQLAGQQQGMEMQPQQQGPATPGAMPPGQGDDASNFDALLAQIAAGAGNQPTAKQVEQVTELVEIVRKALSRVRGVQVK